MSRTTTETLFAKIAIRTKICCTTYKKICIYQKKAVPLHYEKDSQNIIHIYNLRISMDNHLCNNKLSIFIATLHTPN